jgi:primosomal protein N'
MELKCSKCGNIVETIPLHCSQSMIYNEEDNQLECWMGPACGYIKIDEFVCENCCK